MGAYASIAFLLFAGFAALNPGTMPWVYVAGFIVFELWLARRVRSAGRGSVAVLAPPYHFSAEEAALVERCRFYFMYPAIARECSSVLAALGLSSLILAPWLTFKQAFVPAALIGLNLFAVSRLTRICAPLLGLRMAASRGDREALRMLEAHAPAWEKIRTGNAEV